MQRTRKNAPFIIGFLGTISIVSAILIMLYASTFDGTESFLLSSVVMLIAGLFMATVTVGIQFQPFSFKQFLNSVLWTGVNFVAILVLNRYIPCKVQLSIPLSEKWFAVLMGVVEECFFRVWLCGMIYRMLNSAFIAIGASAGVWSVYHISRYGGNFNILLLIFAIGCILGASFIYSRTADGCIFAHGWGNWIA